MKKLVLYISISAFGISGAIAQDIHFSQYDYSPLTLNPALTGVNSCDYRFSANYRNQWAFATNKSPYVTFDFAFDGKFMKDKLFGRDYLGGGILIVTDDAGDGNIKTTKLMFSGAYNRFIDANNRHQIAIGAQGGMVQKRLDFSKLQFPNQFSNGGFDPDADHGERRLGDDLNYTDFAVGGLWQWAISDKYDARLGVAYYHLTKPKESFFDSLTLNQLDPRIVVHAGGRINLNPNLNLVPSILYMEQAKAPDLLIGSGIEYTLHPNNLANDLILGFGAWWRTGDAIILVPSAQYGKWRAGVSYDINISSLRNASNYKGGFEFSLMYVFCQTYTPKTSKSIIPCRVF